MYNIEQQTLDLFKNSSRQYANISFEGIGESFIITESDIMLGGLSINRYCVSGERIEIGSAIAAELTLQLNNPDGKYNDVVFEGGELNVKIGVSDGENIRYVPFGYFTVDEAPRKLAVITLTALDRMVQFDKPVTWNSFENIKHIQLILTNACNICNVPVATLAGLPNSAYQITEIPKDKIATYRHLIMWIAEITGTCVYINWNGQIAFKWYETTTTNIDKRTITPNDRFFFDLEEYPLTISGVMLKQGEDTILKGNDTYALVIEDNSFLQSGADTVIQNIYNVVNGFTYTPFNATTKPMPHIYPLDNIRFIDKDDNEIMTSVTEITFTMNGNTILKGKGESTTRQSWATSNPLTKRESSIINTLMKEQNETLNTKIQETIFFNELIRNSLGLYFTEQELADGSKIWCLHDLENIEDSKVIFTITAGGFAWTNEGWNDGEPVWQYGVTEAGDALFRNLSATGISVHKAGQDYQVEITPNSFIIKFGNMPIVTIIQDEMIIPKAKFTDYAEIGKIRIVPYMEDGELAGTNILYID